MNEKLSKKSEIFERLLTLAKSENDVIILPKVLYTDLQFFVDETRDFHPTKRITIDTKTKKKNLISKIFYLYTHIINNFNNNLILTQSTLKDIVGNKNHNKVFISYFKKHNIIEQIILGNIMPNNPSTVSKYVILENYLYKDLIIINNAKIKKTYSYEIKELRGIYGNNYTKVINTINNASLPLKTTLKTLIKEIDNGRDISYEVLARCLSFSKRIRISKFFNNDRVYNSICPLPGYIRDKITFNGKKMHSIDLASCQPSLLLRKIIKHINDNQGIYLYNDQLTSEIENFKQLINNNNFYNLFKPSDLKLETIDERRGSWVTVISNLSENKIEENYWRDIIKVECYRSFLFTWNTKLKTNEVFVDNFPEISKIMKYFNDNLKQEGKKMASMLQQEEALIFNGIIKDLELKSNFTFTVYDEIYFDNEEDIEIIKEYINDKFKYTGINPQFNTKINN